MNLNSDLAEYERHAYISGDVETAELLARVMDAEEQVSGLEENVSDLETQVKKLTDDGFDDLESLKQRVADIADRLYDALKDAKRVSNRDAILALISELTEA